SNVESWYQLARYHMELKEYKVARLLLLNALDIDPLHAKSHSRLGMVYYYLENPELAKNSYQTALALNPEDFNTHYNLGELYLLMFNDTVKAVNEYKTTIQLSPPHVGANFKMGSICADNKMYKEAILHFEKALETDNANIRILLQLAVAYEKLDNLYKARSVYERITKIDALNVIARQKLRLLSGNSD
ncbi:MAG: tetratricopeptide repeat protein, partial [Fibrobacter sp.]|nr:tetratricopeptide repeat protein [Fibrobacter sp.]